MTRRESGSGGVGQRGDMPGAADDVVLVRIPVRIDFAGGWSDVPAFSAREGGAVLNAAIAHFVEGTASSDGARVDVAYGLTLPPGAGLGASASLDVAWLALMYRLMGRPLEAVELAEAAYRLEGLIGIHGGKQDQYAAALGGFNHLVFGAEDEAATVEPLVLEQGIVDELTGRLVLCYTGSGHRSGALHEGVWERYRAGDPAVVDALRALRDSAASGRASLLAGDLDALAEVLTLNREAARQLSPELVTPHMDRLFEAAARAGALGSKACGAGGGGCLVFMCADGERQSVERALVEQGGSLLPFAFAARMQWSGST